MSEITYNKMLEIRSNKAKSYDGIFYVGVNSTRIYCLPSCKARLPLLKNIIFFASREEAVEQGFRGCKRCKSAVFPNTSPKWLDEVVDYMKSVTDDRITENKIVEIAGVDITTIRRSFKSRFQISLMAYHRKLRLDLAKRQIEEGSDCRKVARNYGLKSISGFRDAFVKEYGVSPATERSILLCN